MMAMDKPHVHYADGVWIARLGNVGGIYAPTLKELGRHWRELGKR